MSDSKDKLSDISKANIDRLQDESGFISKIVEKEIGKSEKILSPWKRKLVKYNELYKMVQNQRHYEGLARIFVPEILRAVETIVGNLYKILFGNTPWFEYEATISQDDPAAHAQSELTRAQMEDNQFHLRTMDSLRQLTISGLTVRKIMWDFKQVNQKKKIVKYQKSIDPITKKEKKERSIDTITSLETIQDTWVTEPVDLLGFHISDVTTPYHNIQKAKWIAEQMVVDKQYVREKIKNEWFVDRLKELDDEQTFNTSESERYKSSRKQSAGYTTTEVKKGIELIERWGFIEAKYVYNEKDLKELELDEDDMVESIIVIANRRVLLKLEANPYWHNMKPYVACPYVAQEEEFSGLGVAAIAESLQEELNDTRNQTMDNKSLILMCMWLKDRNSGIMNKDLTIRPMGVIPTNSMEGLQALRPPVLTGVGVNIEGVVKDDLRQSVGAASNLQGIAQQGVQTATESSIINQTSFGRLALTAQQYSELILKPTLRFAESLNYQFFDTEKTIRLIGEEGIKFKVISPDDIVGKKTITVKLAIDLDDSPGIKRQQSLQFLTIVQQMPMPIIYQHWRLLDKIYKLLFPNGHSLEDLYPAPPGEEQLLSPQEEFELMRQGIPVKVKQGDNDKEHLAQHESDLDATHMALSPDALKLNQEHILNHYEQMTQKMQQAQLQAMSSSAGQPGQETGPKLNAGQTPGASPFTATPATQESDLNRNLGGR